MNYSQQYAFFKRIAQTGILISAGTDSLIRMTVINIVSLGITFTMVIPRLCFNIVNKDADWVCAFRDNVLLKEASIMINS